jgi:predicted O-linked N-acetylglucosamine transferase (SPINDLY family)
MLRWLRSALSSSSGNATPSFEPARSDADLPGKPPSSVEPEGPMALYRSGRSDLALAAARAAIEADPSDVQAHRVGALVALARGQALEAVRTLSLAPEALQDDPALLVTKGRALLAAGRKPEAGKALQRARDLRPDAGEPLLGLALLALAGKREAEAMELLQKAVAIEPRLADAHFELANLQRAAGRGDEAVEHYRRAVQAEPGHVDALNNLGSLMRERGRLEEAAVHLEQAIERRPGHRAATCNLGMVRVDQRRWAQASELLQACVETDPKDADAQYWLGNASMALGRDASARKAYQAAVRANANFVQARWGQAMAQLPAVARTEAEQDAAPDNFRRELGRLRTWFRSNPAAEGQRAVGAQQPFYLAYVARNHRAALQDYGGLCTQLMTTWARKVGVPKPQLSGAARRRIGIVSAHLHSHSVWHAVVKGWVEHLDPGTFELHLFHVGAQRDAETEWAARRATRLVHGTRDWITWARTISDARMDALLYPEIGMDSTTTRLATLRLAPVQAASWGHPITTGLPTMDAYLSAEAFEPQAAADHYSEKLVRLPRLGCCYQPFRIAPAPVDPRAWNIEPGDRLLLCAGTPFKYAPRDDRVLVEIARRCQPCKLVFFRAEPAPLAALLEDRLRQSFESAGLAFERFVRFIPWQSHPSFFGLLDRADVFLDSLGFSGFNTAMQAVERGTPIVAFEGEFMRGRLASAILRQAGLDEWVANTQDDYVDRVCRLVEQPAAREDVRRRLSQARARLFSDRAAVDALGAQLLELTGAG